MTRSLGTRSTHLTGCSLTKGSEPTARSSFRASGGLGESPAYEPSGASLGGFALFDEDLSGDEGGTEADRPLRQARCAPRELVDVFGHGRRDRPRVDHVQAVHEPFSDETPIRKAVGARG